MIREDTIKTQKAFATIKDEYTKDNIKAGVIVLTGSEHLYKKTLLASIKANMFEDLGDMEMNFSEFYDKQDLINSSPIDASDTPPFGSPLRLVIVHNYEVFEDKCDFIEYIKKPSKSSLLILDSNHRKDEDALYKFFSKNKSQYIRFLDFPSPDENDIKNMIRAFVTDSGKKISNEAVQYIADNVNNNTDAINQELEKICNFNKDKTFLDVNDIRDFTYTTKEKDIFEFIDAVFERDRKKCFTILKHLDKEPSYNISLLMTNFMALYYLKIFPPQTTLKEIADITKISEYVIKRKKPVISKFSLREVSFIISELFRLNALSVSVPNNIFKGYFELFLFTITK